MDCPLKIALKLFSNACFNKLYCLIHEHKDYWSVLAVTTQSQYWHNFLVHFFFYMYEYKHAVSNLRWIHQYLFIGWKKKHWGHGCLKTVTLDQYFVSNKWWYSSKIHKVCILYINTCPEAEPRQLLNQTAWMK